MEWYLSEVARFEPSILFCTNWWTDVRCRHAGLTASMSYLDASFMIGLKERSPNFTLGEAWIQFPFRATSGNIKTSTTAVLPYNAEKSDMLLT